MIILGLGGNLGDRTEYLRRAVKALVKGPSPLLRNVVLSPAYESPALLPANESSTTDWNKSFLNMAVAGETSLSPRAFLQQIKQIEINLGRRTGPRWSPREIDIDILAWNEEILETDGLRIPHPELHRRTFALQPLVDVAPFWIHPEKKISARHLLGDLPQNLQPCRIPSVRLVGILNITPDSFSDGGEIKAPSQALEKAETLMKAGASLIDVGAESTRPGAEPVAQEEEWRRLKPVLKELAGRYPVSVDTRYPETAERAIEAGVLWINDVSGLENPKMAHLVAESKVKCVLMHNLGVPPQKEKIIEGADPTGTIARWAVERIEKLGEWGIDPTQIIFDPGFGFGKSPEQSFLILKELGRLKTLGCEILVGHSRKSFLASGTAHSTAASTPQARDLETALVTVNLARAGIEYLRVHNIEANSRALNLAATADGVYF